MTEQYDGFQADLDRMQQAIAEYINPAIKHFESCTADLDGLAGTDFASMMCSDGGSPGGMIPGCTRDAVLGLQGAHHKLIDSLHGFRDTLQHVLDAYRGTDEQNAQHFHSLRQG